MRLLRTGQETVLSWSAGAVDCRVVAAAGPFVLLRPVEAADEAAAPPAGASSLTYLDGMVPMGWDGQVEPASAPGELRFRVDGGRAADRRSAVRIPVAAEAVVHALGAESLCRVIDVSAGGLRLRTPKLRFAVGSTVHVRTQLPANGPAVDCHAVVRGSEPGIAALEFSTLPPERSQEIGMWVVERLRSSLSGQG